MQFLPVIKAEFSVTYCDDPECTLYLMVAVCGSFESLPHVNC